MGISRKWRTGGIDPYSASKAATEIAINSYIKSFFKSDDLVNICTVRAGNVIGGGDWSGDRLIPDIYRSMHSRKKLIIRYPFSTRPWQHVLDVVSGYLHLAQSNFDGAWNFGPDTKKNLYRKRYFI